jgi:hypothetical protein
MRSGLTMVRNSNDSFMKTGCVVKLQLVRGWRNERDRV